MNSLMIRAMAIEVGILFGCLEIRDWHGWFRWAAPLRCVYFLLPFPFPFFSFRIIPPTPCKQYFFNGECGMGSSVRTKACPERNSTFPIPPLLPQKCSGSPRKPRSGYWQSPSLHRKSALNSIYSIVQGLLFFFWLSSVEILLRFAFFHRIAKLDLFPRICLRPSRAHYC